MKFKILTSTILVFAIALIFFTLSQTNDIFISPSGNSSRLCSWFFPCNKLEDGINLAKPGSVIHIAKGEYNEVLAIQKSGTEEAYISIIGQDAVLKGMVITGEYILVSNVEVVNSISHGIMTSGKHVTIQNSSVHHSVTENGAGPVCNTTNKQSLWGSGIKVDRGAEDIIIRDNTSYENCGEGIAVTMGKNVLVDNNISQDNYSVNIYIDNSFHTTVSNNKVICTGNGYLRDGRKAIGIALGEELYLGWGAQRHDNIILKNTVDGCFVGISSWKTKVPAGVEKNLTVEENTVLNSTYRSISLNAVNQNVIIRNNILDIPVFVDISDGVTLSGNLETGASK